MKILKWIMKAVVALLTVAFLIIFYDDGTDHGFDTAFWLLLAVLFYMAYLNDRKSDKLLLLEHEVTQLSKDMQKQKQHSEQFEERMYGRLKPIDKYLANIERIAKHKREGFVPVSRYKQFGEPE